MMNKLFCLLAILIVVPLTSQDKLTAQTAADSAVIVRISSGTRYYYGRFNNNAVTNGDTLQYVFTLMSPKDTLLLRDHSQGGIFQGAFTDNAAGYYVKGGYYGNATAWISADETDGYSVLEANKAGRVHTINSKADTTTAVNLYFENGQTPADTLYGGGIYLPEGSVMVVKGNSAFLSNSSYYGAAIYVDQSHLILEGNTIFSGNVAADLGGAVFCDSCTLTISGNVSFLNNRTYYDYNRGGAIYNYGGTVTISDSVLFSGNTGAIWSNGTLTISDSVLFKNNIDTLTTSTASTYNGTIYLGKGGTTTIQGNTSFVDNIAYAGAGIYANNAQLTLEDNVVFSDNNVQFGGGALYCDSCTLNIANKVSFLNNKTYSDYSRGAGIYNSNGTVIISDTVLFEGNKGAIWSNGSLTIKDYVTFKDNIDTLTTSSSSVYNGTIYVEKGGTTIIQGNTYFNNNKAYAGAGIYANNAQLTLEENVIFSDNIAQTAGGALYCDSCSLTISDNVKFLDNKTNYTYNKGGAIYNNQGTITISDSVMFSGNTGAIWSNGSMVLKDSVGFKENKGTLGSDFFQKGSLELLDNIRLQGVLYLDSGHTVAIPSGSLGSNAQIDTIQVADPYSGRLITQYFDFRPTPLVDTVASAGTEIAKYGFLNNAPYKLYNGSNPYVVSGLKNVNLIGVYPDSYDITMSDSVTTKSFSLYAPIPTGATTLTISSDGKDASLLADSVFEASGLVFRYTQALPGNTYTLTFNDTDATTMDVVTAPTPAYLIIDEESKYTTASDDGVYNFEFISPFEIFFEGKILLNNVRLDVTPQMTVNEGPMLSVQDTLVIYDALCVDVDMSNFTADGANSSFAYLSLPFDVDLRSGVRFETVDVSQAGGVNRSEIFARLNTDYRIRLYSSELRSINGEGNQNWVDVTSVPFTSDYASLTDGYIIPAGVGFIMMIVDSSYYNGNNSDYPSGAGPKNNIYRFYALNPNSLGADAEYSVQVASNGAASVKRHDDYDSDSWQYSWDDGLTFLGLPNSYKASYSASTNMPRYLYMRTPGAGNGGYVALDSEETDITPYSAYFGFMSPTTVGTLETQSISFSGYGETPDVVLYQSNAADKERFIFQLTKNNVQQDMMGIYFNQDASDKYVRNEDAIKMGTNGVNILWNHFQTANYAFNTIPFQGDSMRFQVNLITEETNGYALKAYKPFSNEYDLYITEGNTPQRTLMTDNYQIKSRGNVILWLD